MKMTYGLILLLVVLVVSGRLVLASHAPRRAKVIVALVCIASIAMPYVLPQWQLVGALGQALLVTALVLHSKVKGPVA